MTRKKLSDDAHIDCRTGCKASHPLQCARGNACQRKEDKPKEPRHD